MADYWKDVAKMCKKHDGLLGIASEDSLTCVIKKDNGELVKISVASKTISDIEKEAFGK